MSTEEECLSAVISDAFMNFALRVSALGVPSQNTIKFSSIKLEMKLSTWFPRWTSLTKSHSPFAAIANPVGEGLGMLAFAQRSTCICYQMGGTVISTKCYWVERTNWRILHQCTLTMELGYNRTRKWFSQWDLALDLHKLALEGWTWWSLCSKRV